LAFFYDRAADLIRKIYDSRIQAPPVLDLEQHFPAAGGLPAPGPRSATKP
jgi:hypothetical protein